MSDSPPTFERTSNGRTRNRILSTLPPEELDRMRPHLEPVDLELKRVLIEPQQPIEHVYFVEEGVASILGIMEDGTAVETATVGREGMVGIPVFLGTSTTQIQAFMQIPGRGYRLPADRLREELRRDGALSSVLGRYTQALFMLISQSSACNRKHTTKQRCARWLLMTHDRVEGDTFELTQLFLSQMLGTRRATVTKAAGKLQEAGLIEYSRGRITIRDRAGLEGTSCECYAVVESEFSRMLGDDSISSPLDHVDAEEDGKSTVGGGKGDAEMLDTPA